MEHRGFAATCPNMRANRFLIGAVTVNMMKLWLAGLATVVALSAGAQTAAVAEAPPLITVETFFKPPAYRGLRLSPNGKLIAATIVRNGRLNLVVLDTEKRTESVLTGFTDAKTPEVNSIFWLDDTRLLYTTGEDQSLEPRTDGGLFAIDRDGKNGTTLVEPVWGSSTNARYVLRETMVLARVPGSKDEVFVTANDRSEDSQDIYRMNVQSGRKNLISVSSPGKVSKWVLDNDNRPRAATSVDQDRKRWWSSYQPAGSSEWKTLAQWDEQLRDVIIPVAFDSSDPKTLYVSSNVGRDTLAFFRYDVEAGKLGELVAGVDRYDLGSFLLIGSALGESGQLLFGTTGGEPAKLIGLRFNGDKPTTVWFDAEARRLQASLDAAMPGRINTFDPTQKRTLVRSTSPTDPGGWFIFDKEKRALEDTGLRSRPWIDAKQMAPMTYVTYTARDGMKIGAYLTLPKTFRKGSPVAFVVFPHGGPWAKDNWDFDPEAQFLANRGYAVLQPNFRGSTGYGAQHLRASYKQWGGTMTDDIIDGVEWAIREGYADRGRIGSYGASYGGLATLSVMVKRPDLFKWGINYVGVTDLTVHQDTQPAQLRGDFTPLAKAINGDQKVDAAAFAAQSPARHVNRIAAPVFHAYGGEDRNVDFANGREIRSAFDKAGKPYEWMFVGDEAHGYRQTKNVVEFYTRFEKFIKANTPPAK